MGRLWIAAGALSCGALLLACDQNPEQVAAAVTDTARSSLVAERPAPPAVEAPPTTGVHPAAEVLPPDEVSADGALAVLADGYRFQVPAGFRAAEVDVDGAEHAHAGEIGSARVTVFVTREAFDGDTARYAAERRRRAAAEGAQLGEMSAPVVRIAGEESNGVRWSVDDGDGVEHEQVVAHRGTGYALRCVTRSGAVAAEAASGVCARVGETMHIAPPAR